MNRKFPMRQSKKNKRHTEVWKVSPEDDPANGIRLSLRQRVELAEELISLGESLVPQARYRPFVKSFDSFREYESWRKKQSNPWLV